MPPTTPPMTFLLDSLMPPPELSSLACEVGGSVTVACPVVVMMLLVPVEVVVICRPSLMVVMTVMYSWSDVETRGVVLTMAVVRTEDVALVVGVVDAPPPPAAALEPSADDAGSLLLLLLFPPSELGAAAEVVGAGASDEGAGLLAGVLAGGLSLLLGSGVAELAGGAADDAGGACELAGGAAEEGVGVADGGVDAPVPSASCLLPWWRYWLMPSM
jgi:hypothetical protein